MNVKDLFLKGIENRIQEHDAQEKEKLNTLRGGSSGIITDHVLAGACGRLSYLRMKGIQIDKPDTNRELMFRAGRDNEEGWIDALKRAWKGPILCEEQIPTKWVTDAGIPVTGRPDLVLCEGTQDNPTPVLGLELKLVSSVWTARDVLIKDTPKINHIIQAAHYSWQLDIPFELWYTSRADFHCGSGWERKVFREGINLPEVETNEENEPKKINPFICGFVLTWNARGNLEYTSVQTGKTKETIVSKEAIKRYYNTVASIDNTKVLPPKPVGIKADGSKSYSQCDFCSLKPVCAKSSLSLEEFTEEAIRIQNDE